MAAEFDKHPFLLPVDDVAKSLGTDVEKGLSSAAVAQLREKYPPNELDVGGAISWYTIFLRQLCNAMILVSRNSDRSFLQTLLANWMPGPLLRHGSQLRCR